MINAQDDVEESLFMLVMQQASEGVAGPGAGGWYPWAVRHGYRFMAEINTTSALGDWDILVSKDGREWHVLMQRNSYPKRGFRYEIGTHVFYGTYEEVISRWREQ